MIPQGGQNMIEPDWQLGMEQHQHLQQRVRFRPRLLQRLQQHQNQQLQLHLKLPNGIPQLQHMLPR